ADLRWFSLKGATVDAVIIEIRRCGIDGGWTPWNLVMGAFVLEGERLTPLAPRRERWLEIAERSLAELPRGVEAAWRDGAVHYHTADFAVGFRLDRPGWSHLGLGIEDPARRDTNLLFTDTVRCVQGLQWHAVGVAPAVAPTVRCEMIG